MPHETAIVGVLELVPPVAPGEQPKTVDVGAGRSADETPVQSALAQVRVTAMLVVLQTSICEPPVAGPEPPALGTHFCGVTSV